MFEAQLEKDYESSIQVALRQKLIFYEFTQKLDHEMKLSSGWKRGTTIEWFFGGLWRTRNNSKVQLDAIRGMKEPLQSIGAKNSIPI